ncbi:hypothetical protein EBESD8_4030 [Rhodococcus aetherivorans]|nr:hypothetical protein EBESD8_4030 [Rhodococcus aetherivorans]
MVFSARSKNAGTGFAVFLAAGTARLADLCYGQCRLQPTLKYIGTSL